MTPSSRMRDVAVAGLAFAASLLLYLATLQPDFGGPEDTPKFQFVGYVLGIPHPPGYPLYVLLSHVFVALPVGTIAYRANLFSAVMAAIGCALAYTLGRQLGARRSSAFLAALGMATGASVWRSAVFAEVYSLAAVMAALVVALLLEWGRKGGTHRLVGAFGAFAFALGNHLTVIGVIPAFATYVLTRRRPVWSARMLVASALLLLAGVGQYLLIVVRTVQDAPYLEARADRVSDLPAILTAERYAGQRFAFGPLELLTDHLPAVVSLIARDFGLIGTALFVLGAVAGTRRADSGLVIGAAAGMFAMVLNISGDLKGFITPLMVLLWPSVALGTDVIAALFLRVGPPAATIVALGVAAVVPAANVVTNYAGADQSRHTQDAAFLRGVFARIPDGSGFVPDDYWSDMAWHYYRFTGESGRRPHTARVPFSADAVRKELAGRRAVFTFARGATFLSAEGLHFNRVEVEGIPLDRWLASLPDGSLVIGATAYEPAPLDLSAIGHPQLRSARRPRAFEAFAALVWRRGGAWRTADEGTTSLQADGDTLGVRLPPFAGALLAVADERMARVELAGRTIASVHSGVALAVFAPDGTLLRAVGLPPNAPRRMPFAGSLYEAAGESPCAELTTDRWTEIGPLLQLGGWIATTHAVGPLAIETTTPDLSDLRTRSASLLGAGTIRTTVERQMLTTELARAGEDRPVFRLALDRPVARALARVKPGGSQPSVRICAFEPVRAAIGQQGAAVEIRPDFESEPYFGAGWSDAQRSPTGPVRAGEDRATLLLPFGDVRNYRLSLDLAAASAVELDVLFNGVAVGTCELPAGRPCEVSLPRASITRGVNRLTMVAKTPAGAAVRFTFRGARIEWQPAVVVE